MKSLKVITVVVLAIALLSGCSPQSISNEENRETLPKIEQPYPPDKAVENGDIVDVEDSYSNLHLWKAFLKNLKTKRTDAIRITSYSIEGDPIFYELLFNGKEIDYTFDNSMDVYGGVGKGRKSTLCTGVKKKKFDYSERYILSGCESDSVGNTFSFNGTQLTGER